MNPRLPMRAIVCALALACAATLLQPQRLDAASRRLAALTASRLPTAVRRRAVPDVALVTHEGREVRFARDVIRDRASVIVFFYTRCTGSCPLTTQTMKRLRTRLGERLGRDAVQLVSVTLDADLDSPARLREYMRSYHVDDDATLPPWTFLTGAPRDLERVRRAMGLTDPDPVVDADRTQHAGVVTFGNDRTNRWAALPLRMDEARLVDAIVRIVGDTDTRYAAR